MEEYIGDGDSIDNRTHLEPSREIAEGARDFVALRSLTGTSPGFETEAGQWGSGFNVSFTLSSVFGLVLPIPVVLCVPFVHSLCRFLRLSALFFCFASFSFIVLLCVYCSPSIPGACFTLRESGLFVVFVCHSFTRMLSLSLDYTPS